jgi:hypothetical protein
MGECGELPCAICLVMAKDVRMAVVGRYLEPALSRRHPAIENRAYLESPLVEPECPRFLFPSVTSVALDTNHHD